MASSSVVVALATKAGREAAKKTGAATAKDVSADIAANIASKVALEVAENATTESLALVPDIARTETKKALNDLPKPKDGKDGADGEDGKDGEDGSNGKPGTKWHLVEGDPIGDLGVDGDFALDRETSNVWHKEDDWELVMSLRYDSGFAMMAPKAYSDEKILDLIAGAKQGVRLVTTNYTVVDADQIILGNGTLTITLPTAVGREGCQFRIKNIGTGVISVESNGGAIDGETCQNLNVRHYAIDVLSDGANWHIL